MFYMLIGVYLRECIVAVYGSVSGDVSSNLNGGTDGNSRHMLERGKTQRGMQSDSSAPSTSRTVW